MGFWCVLLAMRRQDIYGWDSAGRLAHHWLRREDAAKFFDLTNERVRQLAARGAVRGGLLLTAGGDDLADYMLGLVVPPAVVVVRREYMTLECDLPSDLDRAVNAAVLAGWEVDSRCVVPRSGYNPQIFAFMSRPLVCNQSVVGS